MNLRTKRGVAGILLTVLALVTVACGDDDKSESGGATENGEAAAIKTNYGADDSTIRVGLLADLSGPFSVLVKDIVLAQQVYWDKVNKAGGIAGRQVKLNIQDNKYDVATHRQLFQSMKGQDANGVLILSQSTGSPQTAAIKAELEAEDIIAIPLSWYSGWADPTFGKNVFEAYTTYCFEAMNAVEYMKDELKAKKVAVVTLPNEAGHDSAAGAKYAIEKAGLTLAYDGDGKVTPPSPTTPNPDNSGAVSAIASSGADVVWTLVNPATQAQLMGQAAAKGFKGKWVGATPSYNPALLKGDVKNLIDSSFYLSAYTVQLGTDVPGMSEMVDAIKAYDAKALASDAYVYGWTEAQVTEAILRKAADNKDLTREGVVKAAFELDKVDFKGLAPSQSWKGDPNSYVVRESYIFKPTLAEFKEGPIGVGSTGNKLLKGPFASEVAKSYDFKGPCYKPAA
ncbi:MAG: ABC transporter substrate-binding protein [Actinomycetota bacterium]|jgi:ABC-type branched-subunit amino acid transport system substrate-binding protein